MEYPLVTAFTLIYNTDPKYVIEAIESIRDNNYPNLQHIIIDDCSPDPSPKQTVKQWISKNNYPCEFYEHGVNFGLCKTLNHVLQLAKGEYLFGCSDDIIFEDKLFREVETFKNLNNQYAAVYSDALLIDENSDDLYGLFIQRHRKFEKLPDNDIYLELLDGNFLPAMAMLWRTSYLREIGGYDENLKFEDYDMHLRLFKKYKIKLIKGVTAKYRIHTNSLIHTIKNIDIDLMKIYNKHLDEKKSVHNLNIQFIYFLSKNPKYSSLNEIIYKHKYFYFFLSKILYFKKLKYYVLKTIITS